jgi:hypothetical protein
VLCFWLARSVLIERTEANHFVPTLSKDPPGFDVIGPFQLSKADVAAGVFVEKFGHEVVARRIFLSITFVMVITLFVVGLSDYFSVLTAVLVLIVVEISIFRPLLIMVRYRGGAYLSYTDQGIDARSKHGHALYKWHMIRSIEKLGPRLLIHIANGGALIVPERSTTTRNLERLTSTLEHFDVILPKRARC